MVSVGTAKMIHCRRRWWWWWCVHDVRLKIIMHRCDVWTCMSAANACWIVLCKCMLDIKCSVLRGWSCAITKSFEFWLRTDEKMGLTLSHHISAFVLAANLHTRNHAAQCPRRRAIDDTPLYRGISLCFFLSLLATPIQLGCQPAILRHTPPFIPRSLQHEQQLA